jgi:RNA polymerase sigma-70 factor, ECF subfamily
MNDSDPSQAERHLADRAAGGDAAAWGALLARHQERLACVAAFRLARRQRGRVEPADVVQEAFAAATARRDEFFAQSARPLFLWLRWVMGNTLLVLHRHHLGVRMRDVRREQAGSGGDETCGNLIAELTAGVSGPATAARHAELRARVAEAMDRMSAGDREVLALRHFEQLSNAEAAQVLGIHERAAAKRYLRALERLREVLAGMPGGLTEVRP